MVNASATAVIVGAQQFRSKCLQWGILLGKTLIKIRTYIFFYICGV